MEFNLGFFRGRGRWDIGWLFFRGLGFVGFWESFIVVREFVRILGFFWIFK